MRKFMESITQKLRPLAICGLCNQLHNHVLAICSSCFGNIIPLEAACMYCANSLPNKDFLVCGQCIKQKPHFDETFIGYRFEEPLRSLLHEFKYNQGLYLAKTLSNLMLQALTNAPKPECLIPVPMHPLRLKKRGFNQAAVLVKLLAKELKIPYDLHTCKKIINTAPQASLNAEERKKNLRQSFQAKSISFSYKHVALIDDLLTTGSTANELAAVLKGIGVQRVSIWCCARTII